MSKPTRKPTEVILGSDIKVGDILWNHGYRWTIKEVGYQIMRPGEENPGRYWVVADCANPEDKEQLGYYATNMSMALREDLTWTREIQD